MTSAHINTIKNHCGNIELMIKAHYWGKDIEEVLNEIQKSATVIKQRVDLIEEEKQ